MHPLCTMLTLDKRETKQSLILARRSNLGARVLNTGKILRGLHTEHTHLEYIPLPAGNKGRLHDGSVKTVQ